MDKYINTNDIKDRIIFIVKLFNISSFPGYDEINFNQISRFDLKTLDREDLNVLLYLLEKDYNSNKIKKTLINVILNIVKTNKLTQIESYEDINFQKPPIAKLALNQLYESELIKLYNQISSKKIKTLGPTKIIKKVHLIKKDDKCNQTNVTQSNQILFDYHYDNLLSNDEKIYLVKEKKEEKVQLDIPNDKYDTIFLDESLEEVYYSYKDIPTVEGQILFFVTKMEILAVPGFKDINFKNLTETSLHILNRERLNELFYKLQTMYEIDYLENDFDESINPLEILNKYKNGAIEEYTRKDHDESWREYVPTVLKQRIPEWKNMNINLFYESSKDVLNTVKGSPIHGEVMDFVVEMSRIIYDENIDDNDDDNQILVINDEIEESIMVLVEMIILPHLEVLDRIKNKNGKILFSNIWNKEFTESLKTEVKNRDDWQCVICEADTDLHVHHKIPREMGGIHHKDNLVTLCASCHGVIETADVKKAFTKCLLNYKKNKFRSNTHKRDELTKSKTLLKQEVERELDSLLTVLNNKGEAKLLQDVIGIMKKIEVIFYD